MPQRSREDRIEAWAAKVQPSVAYCLNCQPRENGEYVWVQGDAVELGEHLEDRGVPEELREDVAQRLSCGNCGSGGLDVTSDIGLASSDEIAYVGRWQSWEKRYSAKLDAFGAFLARYPYLGASHALGREIRKMIAKYEATEIESASWWRARRAEGARRFQAKDLLPPEQTSPISEGRFNHYGQRVFYVAGDEDTALAETLDFEKNEVLAWVQEFQFPKVERVLDLIRPDWDEEDRLPLLALGLLSHMDRLAPPRGSPWKPEYFIPRYIADCAKEAGFRAIRFRSARAFGTNLVVFEWDEQLVRALGEPQTRTYVPREPEF